MKALEKKGECDLYRGLAMAQVALVLYSYN